MGRGALVFHHQAAGLGGRHLLVVPSRGRWAGFFLCSRLLSLSLIVERLSTFTPVFRVCCAENQRMLGGGLLLSAGVLALAVGGQIRPCSVWWLLSSSLLVGGFLVGADDDGRRLWS